jgi:hypothetical protein
MLKSPQIFIVSGKTNLGEDLGTLIGHWILRVADGEYGDTHEVNGQVARIRSPIKVIFSPGRSLEEMKVAVKVVSVFQIQLVVFASWKMNNR